MILRNLAVKISLFVSSLLAIGSLSHAQELWREYEGSVPITEDRSGRAVFDIPLPEGKWVVSYLKTRSTTGMSSATMKDVSVLQVEDGKLRHAFWIVALVDQKNMRWTDEPCKINTVYYKNNYGTGLWKQKCLTVRYRQFLQNNNSVTIDALKYFSENKISNDFNSVSSVYTRYDDLGKFLVVESFSFPSVYGLNNPVVGVLNTSPYHPSLISQHSEEKAYVDAYIKYSEMMAAAFDSAYEGKKSAKLPRMKFPDSEPLDEKTKSGLELLDKALAAKIIDQEEYQKKKSELVERAIK